MNNEFDDIFNTNTEEPVEVLDEEEITPSNVIQTESKPKKKFSFDIKKDKTLFIQLLLIVIWAILTTIIYFFGYPLFEPFINV